MKAVTIGSAVVDIITIVADADIERMTMQNVASSFLLLEQGRKIDANSISEHVGGGAVNTAVAMVRLGAEVAALIKLGHDLNAERVLACLAEEGVDDRLVLRTDKAGTGVAVMVSSHDRNATIFIHRGANTLIEAADVPADAFAGAGLVYVASLSNRSADRFPDLIASARKAGAKVAANPGIRQLTSRTEAFLAACAGIDILILNKDEASALVPALSARFGDGTDTVVELPTDFCPELLRSGLSFGGFMQSLPKAMAGLNRLGPASVLITDGIAGAYLWSEGELLFCPALETEVQGTAGAGDAFAATFSLLLTEGLPEEAALRAAALNAAAVVGAIDTQSGLLGRADLERRLAATTDALPIRRFRPRVAVSQS